MIHYQGEELSASQQYKFLSGSVVPRPIAWVSTLSPDGQVVNLAPFSLFSIVSKDLPLVSLSIMRENGEQKDTAYNLSQTGEGVIHIVDDNLLQEMNASSASLPREESELTALELETIASYRLKVPAIAKAKIRFESRVYQHVPVYNKDQSQIMTDLFILEIVDFYFDEDVFDRQTGHVDVLSLKPIARLAGPNYGILGSTYELPRPQ
ncbi:flavin reductase family protein [uncultured Vagococcus sp.]|uniref:flavin reductase family protein n=1 Tax=uncultured Vagococcus sp. TaxID=189676 RepID=UPI0028D58C79|nr:flavin reductase family protein [uncultured Vagococcus sp.]